MDKNDDIEERQEEDFCFPSVDHADLSTTTNKRSICDRCDRPTPRVCICSSLPSQPIVLRRSFLHVVVHPKEAKTKVRSWPAVGLVLSNSSYAVSKCRRFPRGGLPNIPGEGGLAFLLYPGPNAISLDEALQKLEQDFATSTGTDQQPPPPVQLIVLDATWRYAKDMHTNNVKDKVYPPNLIQIKLTSADFGDAFRPRRFWIRTPPTEEHFSSAEAIAWVLSKMEQNPEIYDAIMKPLDLMVHQWNAHMLQNAKS